MATILLGGLLVGALARPGVRLEHRAGCLGTTAVGVVGSVLGGGLVGAWLVDAWGTTGLVSGMVTLGCSIAGAVGALGLLRALQRS